jgi:hypothetical protein
LQALFLVRLPEGADHQEEVQVETQQIKAFSWNLELTPSNLLLCTKQVVACTSMPQDKIIVDPFQIADHGTYIVF